MGWIMLLITICTVVLATLNIKKNPKMALLVSALVPFTTFYYISKNGYNEVFIFASILYFVVVNVLLFRGNLKEI
ncbi:hypothetical protein [Bacillus sp. 123MFChir2]|uniref:hypothetical protein n=1 Tax=Bacillus sp. 123MFChir2 TaxID=1169144 RepID=UPI00037651F6|nr:hypothetical protein [Bacillus sp. 123MFChir2]